ncbi:MAG TPA: hypothetical protein VIF62_10000 [Labilithrix sp.]
MKIRLALVGLAFSVVGCGHAASHARDERPPQDVNVAAVTPTDAELPALADAAARGEPSAALRLRLAGPRGLDAVLVAYDAESDPARRARLSSAIDAVAKQKDARAARLYWYTDIAEAEKVARASGRPILSLRLLGQLDDELSCANSRFFRTALYPNREVNALLRDKFVLHWSTERPAPVVTIDFRDGRIVRRTVTGNSLHYVMDSDGRIVDAIPGLLGPRAFVRVVSAAGEIARTTRDLSAVERRDRLAAWHASALADLRASWSRDTAGVPALARTALPGDRFASVLARAEKAPPSAFVAMPVAATKAVVERPILAKTMAPPSSAPVELGADVPWTSLAPAHATECRLDVASVALVREKQPRNWSDASAMGRPLDDGELAQLVATFESSMAIDTVKNEYLLHAIVHQWLRDDADLSFTTLDDRVYTQLFKTPAGDPWLGLVPPTAFSALQDDGIVAR